VTTSDGVVPVPLNDTSAEEITRSLTASSEWLGFACQVLAIGSSLVVDNLQVAGRPILAALLIIHLGLAWWTRARRSGPFSAGPPWGAVWLACCAIVPVMMALLVAPAEYGSAAQCVQMCAYPVGPVAMFAFFPWGLPGRAWRRLPVQILTIAGISLEPLFIIYLINGAIAPVNLQSVGFSGLLVVLAFLAGLGIKRICAESARMQFTGLENAYRHQQRQIHDLVRTAITSSKAAVQRGDPAAVPGTLEHLAEEVGQVEYRLSVAAPEVNVLRVLRRLREAHPDRIDLDVPSGPGELPQRVGELMVRGVRNLIDNAMKYGGPRIRVRFRVDVRRRVALLAVTDNGTGFDPGKLEDASTTLHDLRQEARALGGDLLVEGSELLLFASVTEPR
jgi:hypothetical protein